MPSTAVVNTEELAALAQRHRVCWEVWPECIVLRGEKRQVGFVLELSGTFETDTGYPYPDWVARQRVFAALRQIAEAILPREKRLSGYEVDSDDQAFHYSRVRGSRPDVSVAIHIYHRQGFERPVDPCEIRCLKEMEQRLKELGACERQWTPNEREHQ